MVWGAFWQSGYWDYLDKLGIAAALITLLFSILIWLNQKRREKQDNALISVRLQCAELPATISLHAAIRRKDLTRAELLGLLGMLPMAKKGQRYQLAALSDAIFFEALQQAQVQRAVHEVVIPCSREELLQFDSVRLAEVCEIEGELPGRKQELTVSSPFSGNQNGAKTYFISRHAGAVEWVESKGFHVDQRLAHFDVSVVRAGDRVLGTLPIQLVAELNQRGGRYFHLTLELPAESRGRELTAADMHQYGARLQEYKALPVV